MSIGFNKKLKKDDVEYNFDLSAKTDFESSQENPRTRESEQRSVKLDWTGPDNTAVYLRSTEIPGIAKGIRERTTFVIDGTRFKFSKDQWVWTGEDGKGLVPVTGSKGQNYDHKDGSDEALLYRLNNNPTISEALKDGKKSEASSDSTSENKQKKIKDIYDGVKKVEEE